MAILKDDNSKRRRSIAVTNQNQQSIVAPVGKRRAHSIVPGERLSLLAKARRSLVSILYICCAARIIHLHHNQAPRKSILKSSSIVNTEEQSEQSSQPSNSQSSLPDDGNVTESMDLTLDYRARVHDNASRKSFGRRVSFAEHAQVRLFQTPNHDNTNSTGSPQSSPIPSSSPEIDRPPVLSNENDYPRNNRRSSVRYSTAGSEDMDLTSTNPRAFLEGEEGSALMDEEMDFDENDDMEVTEALRGNLLQRRSMAGRRPFAPVQPRDSIAFPSDDAIPSDDDDNNNEQAQSMVEDDSQMHLDIEASQEGMEFTVPMGQSLRPPPTEDPVWLALRQVTHSGDTPHEPEASSEDDIQIADNQQGMDLDDAVARLMRARDSLGGSTENTSEDMDMTDANAKFAIQEDSFLSTDDSLNDDVGDVNETLNVSKVVGRMSLGGTRMSLGYQDSTMDESGIYGSIVPLSSSTPRPSIAQSPPIREEPAPGLQEPEHVESPRLAVFQPPAEETNGSTPLLTPVETTPATEGQPPKSPAFTFVPPPASTSVEARSTRNHTRPTSPIKPKPKPTFSAAFAPPVTKPSPKKPSAPSTPTPTRGTPSKRRFSVMQDGTPDPGRPSPAKRPALGSKAVEGLSTGTPAQLRVSSSPGKRVTSHGSSVLPVPVKRQSGYFARRKSLGNALAPPLDAHRESSTPKPPFPQGRTGGGRASLGSAPSEAWTHFDKNTATPAVPDVIPPTEDFHQEQNISEPIPQPNSSPAHVLSSTPISPISAAPLGWTPPESGGDVSLGGNNVEEAMIAQHPPGARAEEDIVSIVSLQSTETSDKLFEPPISIDQFFTMTGIKFMDELTAPRRSIHPHTGSRQVRNPADIPLSEYYLAMGIDVPQLGLFTRVSKDLQGWMIRSKADFAQAEEEAAKITPELFAEFMRADEEGQAELLVCIRHRAQTCLLDVIFS